MRSRKEVVSSTDVLSLDRSAFRISMLDGTLSPQFAGIANSPPDSQVAPPISCTGVAWGIDYYSCCFDSEFPLDLIDKLESTMFVSFDCSKRRFDEKEDGGWYRIEGTSGTIIELKPVAGGKFRAKLTLGGQYCSTHSEDRFREVARFTSKLEGFTCTRLDLRCDDYSGTLKLEDIRGALEQGNYAGFRSGESIRSYGGKRSGETVYFGGRKSNVRLRFYDKQAESQLEYSCIREELQLRSARAGEAILAILSIKEDESICDYVISRLSGAIVFGERKGKNLERMCLAEFWIKWRDLLHSKPIVKGRLKIISSIQRSLDWFARAASRTLGKMVVALGDELAGELLQNLSCFGMSRLRSTEITEGANYRQELCEEYPLESFSKYLGVVQLGY
jgi:Replication initiation factor